MVLTLQTMSNSNKQYFVSKLMFKISIKDENGKNFDLLEFLKKSPISFDMVIQIGEMKCRLTGKKLPDNIINQKIRKANESSERKGGISDGYKLFLQYALCITNLPQNYKTEMLFTLYRIRWRIELIFKTWKSILAIHKIRTAKSERVMCEVYGKLIIAILTNMMCASAETHLSNQYISLHKAMQKIKVHAVEWAQAIFFSSIDHIVFLRQMSHKIAKRCIKTDQKQKRTIEKILENTIFNPTFLTFFYGSFSSYLNCFFLFPCIAHIIYTIFV